MNTTTTNTAANNNNNEAAKIAAEVNAYADDLRTRYNRIQTENNRIEATLASQMAPEELYLDAFTCDACGETSDAVQTYGTDKLCSACIEDIEAHAREYSQSR
jgi:hypothetical protein